MTEAYPLSWPLGYKRTLPQKRIYSRFIQSPARAQSFLRDELSRLGGKKLIISTNIKVRADGYLYAEMMKKKTEDPGVAIYFSYKDKEVAMCCDQYLLVWENMYALAKGIEGLRGMERWGVSEFLDRAFTGFPGLPAPGEIILANDIWQTLGFSARPVHKTDVEAAYKRQAMIVHPDKPGGSVEAFQLLQTAYKQALSTYQ